MELEAICQALPVFPLPRLVFMPGEMLPLHVFEPRYRELVAHCLGAHRMLAIATLKPGYEADYHDRPPIHVELGIGLFVSFQALPEGRCNLVLQHIARARMVAELAPERPFRQVRATLLEDEDDGYSLGELRRLVLQVGAAAPRFHDVHRITKLVGTEMVDELARRFLDHADDRRTYIGLNRLSEKARMLEERLGGLIAVGQEPIGDA